MWNFFCEPIAGSREIMEPENNKKFVLGIMEQCPFLVLVGGRVGLKDNIE